MKKLLLPNHSIVLESDVKECTPCTKQMLELEFRSCEQERGHSIQNKGLIRKTLEECKFKNSHYELPLSFVEEVRMPNNRARAGQRVKSLKRKLLRNPSFHADYLKFMNDFLSKDYARRVAETTKSEDGKVQKSEGCLISTVVQSIVEHR